MIDIKVRPDISPVVSVDNYIVTDVALIHVQDERAYYAIIDKTETTADLLVTKCPFTGEVKMTNRKYIISIKPVSMTETVLKHDNSNYKARKITTFFAYNTNHRFKMVANGGVAIDKAKRVPTLQLEQVFRDYHIEESFPQ